MQKNTIGAHLVRQQHLDGERDHARRALGRDLRRDLALSLGIGARLELGLGLASLERLDIGARARP